VDLRNKVDLTDDGRAADSWSDNWTDLGVWQKDWAQSSTEMTTTPTLGDDRMSVTGITPLRRFQLRSKLSEDELEVLKDQDLLEGL
jgi:hypothetical protein